MGLETYTDRGDSKLVIEDQLEKEISKVKTIKENIEKSNQITKGIVDILNSFELRLAKLEETILPVYNETGNLQRQQQNIEKVLSLLDHVIGYYSVAEDVVDSVKAGSSIKGLDEYLQSLNRLKGAKSYFEKNNPQSVELENVSLLYTEGVETLLREFQELLMKHSRPMAPITLMDLIANDEDVSEDGSVGSVGTLLGGENIAAELATMASWLVGQGRLELLKIYASVRSSVMLKSVNNLKDHHKSNSKGSTHNIVSPSLSMRIPKSKGEGSGRKRLQAALEKKANKMLLKASQTIENSTGLSIGGRRSNLYLESKESGVEESEMDSYLVCVMGVQRLMTTERNLMATILPASHHNPVYQNIIQDSLAVIVTDGENIAERAKRCISRKDFGSVLVIFPIMKNLLAMRPDFDRAVEGCDYNIRSQFTNILNILHATAGKALEEIVESLRSDSTGLPRDGTVHELTSNTLVTIAQLTEFSSTIAQVLARDPAYQSHTHLKNHPDQTSMLLSLYIRKVLSELNCTLMSKSEMYPETGVKALFRLNNAHHVLKALQRSNLLELVAISEPDCEATYLALMTSHKQAYQTSWNKVVAYITSTDDISTIPGRMRDKDRGVIKERFLGFNKEMEDIVKLQRSYSVPDVELRQSLKRDNKEYILPLYNKFYNSFSNVPFTKNVDKYVKYLPDQVASMIDRFFDVAA